MQNSYFIYSEPGQNILIERFHICTWEFKNNDNFIEIGVEVDAQSIEDKKLLHLELYIPWLDNSCKTQDYYDKLKDTQNSRFIFNDSIESSHYLDGGRNQSGVVHQFSDRNRLCILPVDLQVNNNKRTITIDVSLNQYNKFNQSEANKPNLYFRFSITPKKIPIATRKNGITKSTILYDIKLNQRRNIPENLLQEVLQKELCVVKKCFCFNIVPNSYDLVFFDSAALINVRELEFESFKNYIKDERIKDNDLIVVFNRRDNLDAYAFFSIYSKEYIGTDQLAIGLLISLVSGILLFIPSYKISLGVNTTYGELWCKMPVLFWIVVGLVICTLIYFLIKKFKK